MSIANIPYSDHGITFSSPWFCLGDRATVKTDISGVLINDGKSLTDKSIGVTFMLADATSFHWSFKSAAQLNEVLAGLGLVYHPTTEME